VRKLVWVALLSGLIGFVLGNAFWYLASPLWIDRVVSESQPAAASGRVVATGAFSGTDSIHQGNGNAAVIETDQATIVRFTEFEVTNGPDLKVWLVQHDNPRSSSDVSNSEWIALGPLKGNIGDQNYEVPAEIDSSQYGSVVVWCEAFSVLFAAAPLAPAN
jgi:hypothetical protein